VARVTKNRCRDRFSIQVRLVLDRGVANRVVVNTHSVEKITMKNMRASILVAASSDSDDVFGVHAGRPSAGDLTGADSGAQNALGTAVVGGMLTDPILAIFFVPVFFVSILGLFKVKPALP